MGGGGPVRATATCRARVVPSALCTAGVKAWGLCGAESPWAWLLLRTQCPATLSAHRTGRFPSLGPSSTTHQSQQSPFLCPGSVRAVGESPLRTMACHPGRPSVALPAGASGRWGRLCLASVTCRAGRRQQGPWQRPRKPLIFPTLTIIRAAQQSKHSGRCGFFPAAQHIGAGRGPAVPPWRTLPSSCLLFIASPALCSAYPQNLELSAPGMLSKAAEGCRPGDCLAGWTFHGLRRDGRHFQVREGSESEAVC